MARKPGMNVKPLQFYAEQVARGGGPVGEAFRQWGLRYLAFTKRRFVKLSKGGGWPPLKQSTLSGRRKGRKGRKGKRKVAILRDTGALFNALDVRARGNLFKKIPNGIRVGFAPTPHPEGQVTIQELAIIHDAGLGNNPKREILVEPDGQTKRSMIRDYQRAMAKLGKQAERKL